MEAFAFGTFGFEDFMNTKAIHAAMTTKTLRILYYSFELHISSTADFDFLTPKMNLGDKSFCILEYSSILLVRQNYQQ